MAPLSAIACGGDEDGSSDPGPTPIASDTPATTTPDAGEPATTLERGTVAPAAPASTDGPAAPAETDAGTCHATIDGSVSAEWDGVGGPFAVTSSYWLSEGERASYEAALGGPPQALLLNCGTADGTHLVTLSADEEALFAFAAGPHEVGAIALHPDALYIQPDESVPVVAQIDVFDETRIAGSATFEDPSVNGEPVTVFVEFDYARP